MERGEGEKAKRKHNQQQEHHVVGWTDCSVVWTGKNNGIDSENREKNEKE
jgi:hypothetical protein